jgi:heterodisulfide reductase subunit D
MKKKIGFFKRLTSKTLYFPGCLTKNSLRKEYDNYKEILNILGVDYLLMNNANFCCGMPAYNGGYKKETKELAQSFFNYCKENNILKIITNCPSCYHTFHSLYPQFVRDWNIEAEHISVTIYKALLKKKLKKKFSKEYITYHDPCHLGRYENIYDEPRKVLEMLGGEIIEMKHNRNNALCCGGGGGVRTNFEKLAKDIASVRVKEVDERCSKIINSCPLCHSQLSEADERGMEFSTFVLQKLKTIK